MKNYSNFNLVNIKSFIKNIFKKKKIINCKYCNEKLRIPYLKGKRLRVLCPHCSNTFEVFFPK